MVSIRLSFSFVTTSLLFVISWSLCQRGKWIDKVWIPDADCPLRKFDSLEAAKCLHNKTLLIAGNSVSRHFFMSVLNILRNQKEDPSIAVRLDEKKFLSAFLEDSEKLCAPKRNLYKDEQEYGNCKYNLNYVDSIHSEIWHVGGFSGNISFVWLFDWDVPVLAEYLKLENTIVTSNAGLNLEWSYRSKLTNESGLSVAYKEFPNLWNFQVAKTSKFVYRQTTISCLFNVSDVNEYILNYTTINPRNNKVVLDMDYPTKGRLFYIDCNHHPGPQAVLTVQMLLNAVCEDESLLLGNHHNKGGKKK